MSSALRLSPHHVRAVGFAALLLGAIDPLEGSWMILAGAIALAVVGRPERAATERNRDVLAAALIAIGVAAMWILSSLGGIGGPAGQPVAWAITLLPYPIGWLLAVWSSGRPRWGAPAAIGVGVWYLAIAVLALRLGRGEPGFLIGLAVFGVGVSAGSGYLSWRQRRLN
jgi:hypothetical protein